jgi:hypothetical protein
LYAKAAVAPQIVFNPLPNLLLSLPNAIHQTAESITGDFTVAAAMLNGTPAQAKQAFDNLTFGNLGLKIYPDVILPTAAAVPLKSNVLTYGPWSAAGAAGKVKVESDPSLVPWNYDGFDAMNEAGNARVATTITNMQVSEAGSLEMVGAPTHSLGDTLQSGGPNVSNIEVSIGKQGVSTTYRFATFTPRFGVFSKQNIERIKKLSQVGMQLQRSMRTALKEQNIQDEVNVGAFQAFLANAPKAVQKQSPHDDLVSKPVMTIDGTNNLRVGVSTATYEEVIGLGGEGDPDWQGTSVMSVAGLLRPFSTSPTTGTNMSRYAVPANGVSGNTQMNRNSYDPWSVTDVEVLAWGSTYPGMHAYR